MSGSLLLGLLLVIPAIGQEADRGSNKVLIDASAAPSAPEPSGYRADYATSPSGETLGLNSRYLTRNGRPWLPVMGEFHFSRVPADEWEEEILKMKAAGVNIVATYVFWIHHEEIEGQFDWSGDRDLRRFVELCAKHGMDVVVRVGPWDHGEARNGGFPDWVVKQGPTREIDPIFMNAVAKLDAQIGAQLRGLMWKDGGPIIGVQLENEYAGRGPKRGAEYILALKELAIRSGLDVPFYTVTGWDNAVVPAGQVLPVFGGYPDAPWDGGREKLQPNEVYLFRFENRVSGDMGMAGGQNHEAASASNTPFITAEMGGAVQDTYHRRPVIAADDVAAMMPVMLGSGVNLYGTYMFQGGENPDGKRTTLQESHASGSPTDVPVKSYDFQAPLGEFGQERESLRKLKVFDYFLNAFGSQLATMTPHAPAVLPKNAADFSTMRAAVRSRGDEGFVFVNNYVRGSAMPVRTSAQFTIQLPGGSATIPDKPVTIPSGAYFIWPFNLHLGPTTLRYSTAQLFTRLDDGAEPTWVFEEIPGIQPEFVLDDAPGMRIDGEGATFRRSKGIVTIASVQAAFGNTITIHSGSGQSVKIMLLTQHEAENAWLATIDGKPHLIETDQAYFGPPGEIVLRSEGTPEGAFSIYPALHRSLTTAAGSLEAREAAGVSAYRVSAPERPIALGVVPVRKAGAVAPVEVSAPLSWQPDGVAMAPPESAFDRSAAWKLTIQKDFLTGLSDVFLRVDYAGDVARLSSGGRLLDDDFYNGQPWSIGLRRFAAAIAGGPLELEILPLRKDAPIYLERHFWPDFQGNAQITDLKKLTAIPEYQFVIRTGSN
ncbi:MAG: beta-galactosidase [Acidobacteriota bacterium]